MTKIKDADRPKTICFLIRKQCPLIRKQYVLRSENNMSPDQKTICPRIRKQDVLRSENKMSSDQKTRCPRIRYSPTVHFQYLSEISFIDYFTEIN